MAQLLIEQNDQRVPKRYRPRPETGELHLADRLESVIYLQRSGDEAMVLGRNWYILKEYAELLRERGVPFVAEHHAHWSPLGRPKVIEAVRCAINIGAGKNVSPKALAKMLDFIPTFAGTKEKGDRKRLLPHGLKKKIDEFSGNILTVVQVKEWGLDQIVAAIQKHGPTSVLIKDVDPGYKKSLIKLIDNAGGKIPKPHVIVTTIHRAKGRQASTVVVLPEMAKATWEAYLTGEFEPENRVAYVAVTRAINKLIVCRAESDRHYRYAQFLNKVLDDPPPAPKAPTITAEEARELLTTVKRYEADVEKYVVETWRDLVEKAQQYPHLRPLAREQEHLEAVLLQAKLSAADARWAAYHAVLRYERSEPLYEQWVAAGSPGVANVL